MLRAKFFFNIVAPAILSCWTAILIYSAIASDTGFNALNALDVEVEKKSAILNQLKARRGALEKRADQLNSKSLDPDLLDQRVREILGYSREGDVIISRQELHSLLSKKSAD